MTLHVESAALGALTSQTAPQDAYGHARFEWVPPAFGRYRLWSETEATHAVSVCRANPLEIKSVPPIPPTLVAHRGVTSAGPENTMPAFIGAIAAGATIIEADTLRTADQEWVIFHDGDVRRTTDASHVYPDRTDYSVASFTLSELAGLTAIDASASQASAPIPTLTQLLDYVDGTRTRLFLETKEGSPEAMQALISILDRYPDLTGPGSEDQLVVTSMHPGALAEVNLRRPGIDIGLAAPAIPELESYSWIDLILPRWDLVTPVDVSRAHARGLGVYAWTANEDDAFFRVANLGTDGVLTDALREGQRIYSAEPPYPTARWRGSD